MNKTNQAYGNIVVSLLQEKVEERAREAAEYIKHQGADSPGRTTSLNKLHRAIETRDAVLAWLDQLIEKGETK